MKMTATGFDDLFILEPKVMGDERGYFMESYNARTFSDLGINYSFVQDNESRSKKGVLRGLHYQQEPYAQTKLVRVLAGVILDVVVDIRKEKPTYKKSFILEMSGENKKQLLVPKGFAHGFLVLSDYADVIYKTDQYYHPESEAGINFNDPSLNLEHIFRNHEVILSEKDQRLPNFDQASILF
jgi:dTDP-4-dehydrorhamnose 3,5-epimerase